MGRKSKKQEEQEALETLEALAFLGWFFDTLKSPEKTRRLVKSLDDAGKYADTSLRILQEKDNGSRT